MKLNLKKFWWVFVLIFFFVAIDIASKILVFKQIEPNGSIVLIKNFLTIERVWNDGASFGMLSGKVWFFVSLTIIMLVIFTAVLFKNEANNNVVFRLSFAFVVGGAIGNLTDRLAFKMVRDFIHLKFFPAIFNFADLFVTIGTVLLIVFIIFLNKPKKVKLI